MSFIFPGVTVNDVVNGRGLTNRRAVRIATTTNGNLSTAFSNGQIIDGVTLVTGNRILLKDQTTGTENGVYVVTAGALTRADDFRPGELVGGTSYYVREGTISADFTYTCTNIDTNDIVDTNTLVFVRLNKWIGNATSNLDMQTFDINNVGQITADITISTPTIGQVVLHDESSNEIVGLIDASIAGQVLTSDSVGGISWTTPNVGEINTSSSAAGVSLVLAKNGVDLPFKGLTAGTNIILTPGIDDVTITSNSVWVGTATTNLEMEKFDINNADNVTINEILNVSSIYPKTPDTVIKFGEVTTMLWQQIGQIIYGEAINDQSGESISLSSDGTIIAIGGIQNDGNGNDSGHTRIYVYNSGTMMWEQRGQDIDGEVAGDRSGIKVSLSSDGNIVAIGARFNDGNGTNSGHTRIYVYNSGTMLWEQRGQDIDGEATGDQSGDGLSLSSDGNIVAIGATFNDGNGNSSGHTKIYVYNSGTMMWEQRGQDIDGEAVSDFSGRGLSISSDGNIVAIGARFNDGNGSSSGHTRIYVYNSGTMMWEQRGQDIDGEAAGDQSGDGLSISSDGSIVAIGAIRNSANGTNSGHTRIYVYNSGTMMWEQRGQDIDGDATGDQSGYSVSLSSSGNRVAIGAITVNGNQGRSRIYNWNSNTNMWEQVGQDINGLVGIDQSGYSVSLSASGDIVAVSGIAFNGGNVRIFYIDNIGSITEVDFSNADINNVGQITADITLDTPIAGRVVLHDDSSKELVKLPFAVGSGYLLTSNSSGAVSWTAPAGSGISTTLATANILVGNSSNIATSVSMNGDTIISNTGLVNVIKLSGPSTGGTGSNVGSSPGGTNSIHIGYEGTLPSGIDSVGIGQGSLNANTGGENTAIGYQSCFQNTSGSRNTAVGKSLVSNTTGSNNCAIGLLSEQLLVSGNQNVAVGNYSLRSVSSNNNTAIGYNAMSGVWFSGIIQTSTSLLVTTITSGIIYVGLTFYNSMGVSVATVNSFGTGTGGTGSYGIGTTTVDLVDKEYHSINSGSNNTGIGHSALTNMLNGFENVAIGYRSGVSVTEGSSNIMLGLLSGGRISSGSFNICLGINSGRGLQTYNNSIAIGFGALSNTSANVGSSGSTFFGTFDANVAIGQESLRDAVAGTYSCTSIGSGAGVTAIGRRNTFIGSNTSVSPSSSSEAVSLGYASVSSFVGVSIGSSAGVKIINSIISYSGPYATSIGNRTIAMGSDSICIGRRATMINSASTDLDASVIIGSRAGDTDSSAFTTTLSNVSIGSRTLGGVFLSSTSASNNVIVGTSAAGSVSTASGNVVVGDNSGAALTTGNNNTFIGRNVSSGTTSAFNNVVMGNAAAASLQTGDRNIVIGDSSNVNSGSVFSIVIGSGAISTQNQVVVLGSLASSAGFGGVAIGQGANANFAGSVVIGTGITDVTQAGLFVKHRGPVSATVNSAGWIAGTNELVEISSSRRYKQDIRDLEIVSDKIDLLRPVRYRPKEGHGDTTEEHLGFIAEEVEELYPETVTKDSEGLTSGMMYDRLLPVLLKEIQELRKRVAQLESK